MLNFMQSELYKVLHRKCTYVFFLVFGLGGFAFNIIVKALTNAKKPTGAYMLGQWEEIVIVLGVFLVYMIAQMVHSNESKTGILKNSISYGCSRTKIYIARFLSQLVVLVIAVAVVGTCVMLGSAVFFHGVSLSALGDYYKLLALMTVLWIGAVSLAHALAMNLNSNTVATVIYILYFALGPNIITMIVQGWPKNTIVQFIGKNELYLFSLNTFMAEKVNENITKYFIIGGVYFAVTFIIGLFFFRRKEVK